MLFNTLLFAEFFLIFYLLYLLSLPQLRLQNVLLLTANLIFYGSWDWRFLFLLIFTTSLDYFLAGMIFRSSDPAYKKRLLALSIASNLLVLGFFKYFNFFASN